MEIISMERWIAPRQTVKAIDSQHVTVNGQISGRTGGGYDSDYYGQDRYYVENLIEALDSPGEWYLDRPRAQLYYWPLEPAEITAGEFVVPELYQLVNGGSYPENTAALTSTLTDVPATTPCGSTGTPRPEVRVYPARPDALSFATKSFTVTFWLRLSSIASPKPYWPFVRGDPYFGKNVGNNAGNGGYGLGVSTPSANGSTAVLLQFFVNDGTKRFSADLCRPLDTQWYHFAFVVDRTQGVIEAFLNAAPARDLKNTPIVVDISGLGAIGGDRALEIGPYMDSCSQSAISDLRIYSQALGSNEIAAIMAGNSAAAKALLLLPFNGDFRDSTGSNQTVVFYAPAFTQGVRAKAADFSTAASALDLSGSVDYIGFSHINFEYTDWTMPATGDSTPPRGPTAFAASTGYPGSQAAFSWSSPSAIYLHSRHARLEYIDVRHTGSHAFSGMLRDSVITGSSFADIGGAAIKIGQFVNVNTASDSYRMALDPLSRFSSGDSVTCNRINDTGVVVHDSAALTIMEGENNTISQNFITNAPYTGLSLGWNSPATFSYGGSNKIVLNKVVGAMQLMNDGAGLYLWGNQPGTVVDRNWIQDILKTPAHLTDVFIWGIYLDDTSRNITVQNNLTDRSQDGGIMLNSAIQGNVNNRVRNNIFVDGTDCRLVLNQASNDTFHGNIVYYSLQPDSRLISVVNGVFDCGDPKAAPEANGPPSVPPIASSDYNLFFSPSGSSNLATQFSAWQMLGFDQHSVLADPMFTNYLQGNFTLLPSSPALRSPTSGGIGFNPINFAGLASCTSSCP